MLRSSEWVLLVYYVYCMLCSVVMPVRAGVMPVTLAMNTLVIGGLLLLAYAENLRHRRVLAIMRDWYPLPLMLLAYREMGWFAPAQHTYELERAWIVYDRLLLNDWGLRALIESTGPLLPSILDISYSLVYAIAPFCMGWLYHRHRIERMNGFLTTFLLASAAPKESLAPSSRVTARSKARLPRLAAPAPPSISAK